MGQKIRDIAKVIGINTVKCPDRVINQLLIDSRSLVLPQSTLFFAIISHKGDGHRYIKELYDKGVRDFVVTEFCDSWENYSDANFLLVKDSTSALQQIACSHRVKFNIPVISITGSNGKTIVKEWIYQLLSNKYTITRSPRSYNSQIGVPLSLWDINHDSDIAIIEAGISKPMEMQQLANIINPTIAIFTYLGDAHQENFVSLKEKMVEKCKLLSAANSIIYCADNEIVDSTIRENCGERHKLISWSKTDSNATIFVKHLKLDCDSTLIEYIYNGETFKIKIPFTDSVSIDNAMLCVTLMVSLNIDNIPQRVLKLEPVAMRLEVKEGINGTIIIDDSYNSDINSLEAALDFLLRRAHLSNMSCSVILSDIYQAGDKEERLYKRVANMINQRGILNFMGIGKRISNYFNLFPKGSIFYTTTQQFISNTPQICNSVILIKGARAFKFNEISSHLSLKRHQTILEVNLDALLHNYNILKGRLKPSTKVICMLKASGYGAGSYELAKTLQDAGCNYIAVAVADEGAELREAGITMPIIVMNPEIGSLDKLFNYNLQPEIYSFELLNSLKDAAKSHGITQFPIHIKIDTGMHRLGFDPCDMERLAMELHSDSHLVAHSAFSHLVGSDDCELDQFTLNQIKIFTEATNTLQRYLPNKLMLHILNTAGIIRFAQHQFDCVRGGIGLYGVSPFSGFNGFKCVSTLKTTILQIKEIDATETVGYGRRGTFSTTSTVAAIPIGYADGVNRGLGNGCGEVYINGKHAKIVGNICMDITMIDITGIDCKVGDMVEIFGEHITPCEIAMKLGTIPYEILTSVSERVKHIYYRE